MDNPLSDELTAAILSVGDELLIGQVVNTNATFIGKSLTSEGYSVREIASIGDREDQIRTTIRRLMKENTIVISTGGLGPTHDDITKQVLLAEFGGSWVQSTAQLAIIHSIFEKRGRPVTDLNRLQADVPSSATALINDVGTAPGLWFHTETSDLFVLPGVPREMEFLMEHRVKPIIRHRNPGRLILQRTLKTTGIAESTLAEAIGPVSGFLPDNATLAFLPNYGGVRLRVMIKGTNESELRAGLNRICTFLIEKAGRFFYGEGDGDLEHAVFAMLSAKGKTLSVAESCTGGLVADRLTNIPGVSSVYLAGFNPYSNAAKTVMLGVNPLTLQSVGAVSSKTAEEMAIGARKQSGSDFSLAITGIAGPDGGTPEKPVGLIWCAVSSETVTRSFRVVMPGDRRLIKERASSWALNHLREFLMESLL